MIIPNLMVTDMGSSIAFYRDTLGMKLSMVVMPDREVKMNGDCNSNGGAFATLDWDGGQIMLQTNASLSEDLPVFSKDQKPSPSGTIYFRGMHPDRVKDRLTATQIVKGPELSWYGMMELYLRDPDGHIICLGAPEGPPPA